MDRREYRNSSEEAIFFLTIFFGHFERGKKLKKKVKTFLMEHLHWEDTYEQNLGIKL